MLVNHLHCIIHKYLFTLWSVFLFLKPYTLYIVFLKQWIPQDVFLLSLCKPKGSVVYIGPCIYAITGPVQSRPKL